MPIHRVKREAWKDPSVRTNNTVIFVCWGWRVGREKRRENEGVVLWSRAVMHPLCCLQFPKEGESITSSSTEALPGERAIGRCHVESREYCQSLRGMEEWPTESKNCPGKSGHVFDRFVYSDFV